MNTINNDKLKGFLKDDLKELENDHDLMSNDKLKTFVYYWLIHYKNI
jgi:hypothetical protein